MRMSIARVLRSLPCRLALALLVLVVLLVPAADRTVGDPVCGMVYTGEGERCEGMLAALTQYGFVRYADEASLRRDVRMGSVSAGVLFPDDMEARIQGADIGGSVIFISSPISPYPSLFRIAVQAELFVAVAPYIGVDTLTALSPEYAAEATAIVSLFDRGVTEEAGFALIIETVDGRVSEEGRLGVTLIETMISCLFFLIFAVEAMRVTDREYLSLRDRIGALRALKTVLLPELVSTLFLTGTLTSLALSAASLIYGDMSYLALIPSVWVLALMDLALAATLAACIRHADTLQLFFVPLLILSLILCPIYIDVAILSPALAALRVLVPGAWMHLSVRFPLACALGGALFSVCGVGLLFLRARRESRGRIR